MRDLLLGYGLFAMYYILTVYCIYFFIMGLSFRKISSVVKRSFYARFKTLSCSEFAPPVSILVPSYNEELTIIESVRSLLSLNYPAYEVIVVNDGSQDETLKVLIEEFKLERMPHPADRKLLEASPIAGVYHNPNVPKLYVLDKRNGGKADALNVGINFSNYPLICTIDADSLLEKDALIRMASVYMENPEETVGVGGNVRIANGCVIEGGVVKKVGLPRKLLSMMQTIEYLKAFLGGRIGWSSINALLIISGAFGLFRKKDVVEVGGYREGFPGEDMNIVIKLHKHMLEQKRPYRIAFCPDAVCWTQAPDTFRILGSQRKRWGRGNIKNMWDFRKLLFNPKYKQVGLLAIPYNVLFETLNPYFKMTGLLALIGYAMMDMTKIHIVLTFFLVNILISLIFNCGALLLEEIAFRRYSKVSDILRMSAYAVLISLGYDQLNAIWRFFGQIDFLRNKKTWGVMVRKSWKEDSARVNA
jgi:cellulose synthase/poly-beta-1,6-N-acetylglucosamine synthase-like glycosyltransferase